MKKIMMTKYGFERWPEEDFSDDGNRFTCYRVGRRVRVSKLVVDGEAYVAARIDGTKLPYKEYCKLTHYSDLDKLNGVSVASLTDTDFQELYEACLAYEQEYDEAEANLKMPTLEDIQKQCELVQTKHREDLKKVEEVLTSNVTTLLLGLSEYSWKALKEYTSKLIDHINYYDPKTYPQKILGICSSFDFCKPDAYVLTDSFYYKHLMDIINSVIKQDA